MNTHSKIKEFRQKKNFSQADMAEKLDIALLNYGKIERGVTELSVKRLYEIAKILEVSVIELLGEPTQTNDNEKVKELENQIQERNKLLAFYENAALSVNNNYIQSMLNDIWEKDLASKGKTFEVYKYEIIYKVEIDNYIKEFLINVVCSNDLGISLANGGLVTTESLKESFNTFKNWIPQKYKTV